MGVHFKREYLSGIDSLLVGRRLYRSGTAHRVILAFYLPIGYQPRGCRLNGNARCWTTSHDGSDRTVICSPFVTSAVSRLLTCTIVIARLRRFFLAIVDSRIDSTTPGSHLRVQMHAHSREATSYLGLGPGVRCRMLDRSQMMWGFHKYRFCLLYTSPSPRDQRGTRMPSSA